VEPHSFIESIGNREDLLVADLGDVISGVANQIYLDTELFVTTTYFTKGLTRLLRSVYEKITLDKGNSIFRLQSYLGGGKTHNLIALHHFLKFKGKFFPLSGIGDFPDDIKVVNIIGTHLNPLEGRKVKNLNINTLWGELAYQLEGVEGYQQLESNDIRRISPGKEKIFNLLEKTQSIVILIDEITEYIAKAKGVPVTDSNLGTQSLLFLQELTESLISIKNSILVITLPDMDYEISLTNERSPLIEIDHILGRLASSEIPSEKTDIFQIVQKKLIKRIIDTESLDEIVETYTSEYIQKKVDFPDTVTTANYKNLMKQSYPFHPSTISLFYEIWNNLSTFQGTRSTLSLLSRILYELYSSNTELSLILPSDIDLTKHSILTPIFQYLPSDNLDIFRSDYNHILQQSEDLIANEDWKNYQSKIIAIFFLFSVPIETKGEGCSIQELNLALWHPKTSTALIQEILTFLKDKLRFIHKSKDRYYFSSLPNLNYEIQELKKQHKENALREIESFLHQYVESEDLSFIIWPKVSQEIPDDTKLKIVLLSPSMNKEAILADWIQYKGDKFRKYKNTLLFSIPDKKTYDKLIDLFQVKLAIKELQLTHKSQSTVKRDDEQHELESRSSSVNSSISHYFDNFYLDYCDGIQHFRLTAPRQDSESFSRWILQELVSNEILLSKLHPSYIKDIFLEKLPSISTQNLLDQFYQDQELPKLVKDQVLMDSLVEGVEKQIFRIESVANEKSYQVKSLSKQRNNQISIEFSQNQILLSTLLGKRMKSTKDDAGFIKNKKSNDLESIDGLEIPQIVEDDNFTFQINELNSKLLTAFQKEVLDPLVRNSNEVRFDISIRIKNRKNENTRDEIAVFRTAFKRFLKNRTDSKKRSNSTGPKK
jgi:hypothetical protein